MGPFLLLAFFLVFLARGLGDWEVPVDSVPGLVGVRIALPLRVSIPAVGGVREGIDVIDCYKSQYYTQRLGRRFCLPAVVYSRWVLGQCGRVMGRHKDPIKVSLYLSWRV